MAASGMEVDQLKRNKQYSLTMRKITNLKLKAREAIKNVLSKKENTEPYRCLIVLTVLFEKSGLITSNKSKRCLFIFSYVFYATVVTQLALNLIFVYSESTELFYIQLFTAYFNITTFINYNILIFKNDKRIKLLKYMNTHFISKHEIYRQCIKGELLFSSIISSLFIISSAVWFLQPWITQVTDEEMAVYNFSRPRRRFTTQLWAPVDLTVSPYYELFFPFILYFTFIVAVSSLELFTSLPIVGLHIKAQLDILGHYLTLVGHPDILSVNIKTGQILYHTQATRDNVQLRKKSAKDLLLQIVKQHQLIIRFIKHFEEHNQIFFAFRIFLTISLLLGVLCQYVFTNSQRIYIFLNVISVMQFNFFLCTCSELINSGYYSMHKRSYDNQWYLNEIRDKDITEQLIMISHCSPKFKYLKFKYLDIGFQSFIGSIRLTYSLLVFLFYVQK